MAVTMIHGPAACASIRQSIHASSQMEKRGQFVRHTSSASSRVLGRSSSHSRNCRVRESFAVFMTDDFEREPVWSKMHLFSLLMLFLHEIRHPGSSGLHFDCRSRRLSARGE